MQHYLFFLLATIPLLAVLLLDRKRFRIYALLAGFILVLAFLFETICSLLGFWQYFSLPQMPIVSLYTWLLYAHYGIFCYCIGTKLGEKRA
jgi:hypothetical protein